jgi:Uma2 family endonuclease
MTAALNTDTSASPEFVVLCGISWETYERVLDAIGEYHLRHTYDRGMLEMRRVLYGVTPSDYQKLMDALAEHKLRHTYARGTLEMMAPRKDHEWIAELLGRMIDAMAFALDIPIQSVGSTTLTPALGEGGLQPDKAYYVANERRVRGKERYDPDKDAPPDLVVEVDVTNTVIPRLPVYGRIGVPEIWRHAEGEVSFYGLAEGGQYQPMAHSAAFPFLTPADVARFLSRRLETDENSVVREFVAWAKKCSEGQT